ncbi:MULTISPECIES: porin [Flavobacterium]|uniref:Porin n=1 Tax=Flavobacterium hankyongi TaxID=1176532 RepID=A0ABP8ZJP0_9FLAO|nr:porin [Flavobacterium sp. N1846]
MNTKITIITTALFSLGLQAQTDSTKTINPLKISGYIETYYAYDFGQPENSTRPGFIYSHNRHNEVALNLGFIKAAYEKDNVRANLALMAGTYSNANLTAEEGVLKNIYEANAGVKLSKTKNLWVDAGIFASHIGFESAIGKDCWNVTRSMLADNSPYYESGVKLSYTSDSGKWFVSGLVLNGWQRIQRVDGNKTLAFGHQLTYKPNEKVTLNSSSFIGNDKPNDSKQMRYFHNLYGQFQLNEKWGVTAGFDIGAEQKTKGSKSYNCWYSPVLIAKYKATDKINIAARGEYYSDENAVIIATGTPNGFQTFGYSVNLDYNIYNNVVWRIEGRNLSSKDEVFSKNGNPSDQNFVAVTALAISF